MGRGGQYCCVFVCGGDREETHSVGHTPYPLNTTSDCEEHITLMFSKHGSLNACPYIKHVHIGQ